MMDIDEISLDGSPTGRYDLRWCLVDEVGRYLHLAKLELTSHPELARYCSKRQIENIRRVFPAARAMRITKGPW